MMRNDLLEAQASVDWPQAQFLGLNERLEGWLKSNVHIDIEELPPPAECDPIIAVERELLPLAFNVEVGAYINAIRSSLDILAMALVRRYGIEINPAKVQFPVARSAEDFANGNYQGKEFVEMLPPDARRVIDYLRPYSEGNKSLWTLHQLDIKRKHRALLDVQVRPLRLTMAGANISPADFVPINNETGWLPVNEKMVLGLLRKGAPRPDMRIMPCIAINEAGVAHRKPVIASLLHFASVATFIIKMFDV
jgi:hypothetical protein